ncbi:hypothetical protein [Oscillibacter sp.]|uniref:hypothetical protein n=1 Tax=Oscillibacter sp. TaxID=1945593 RepID=UPI00289C3A33|nr:hypothetical protein [Oscillibacter sp.]
MDALQKITEAQMDANGVCSAPNVLNGTVAQNKAVFDKMVRQLVAPAYNAAVDAIGEINATETGIRAEEALRVTAECGRVGAENGRVSAEAERLSSETLRSSAESARISAETARSAAESGRVNAENGRAGTELERVNAETARAAAEAARAATEVARVGAEAQRAAAESARNVWESFNAAKAYTAGNKVSYLGSSYVCIQAGAGNLPTNTAFWTLIAAKGVDGEGAGDMLAATYDPTGKAQDIFAYADQKASGAAAAVQASLNAHTGRMDNPHGITREQIGAETAGSAASVYATLSPLLRLQTGLGNEYTWEKWLVSYSGNLLEGNTTYYYSSGTTVVIDYSDAIIYNPKTKKLSLVGPISSMTWSSSLSPGLAGKYIHIHSIIQGNYLEQFAYVSDATATYYSGFYGFKVAHRITPSEYSAAFISCVNSSVPNAYPISDGYTYIRVKSPGDNIACIETGEYIGIGADSKKFTFSDAVLLLFIHKGDYSWSTNELGRGLQPSTSQNWQDSCLWIQGQNYLSLNGSNVQVSQSTEYEIDFHSKFAPLNVGHIKYYYVALCLGGKS